MYGRRGADGTEVSMIGTLPPLKGISPYCAELTRALSGRTRLEFLDFKRLYPERLYPGGTRESDLYPIDPSRADFSHRRIIDATNPLTWLRAGLTLTGRVVHAQWWTGVLAPVYYAVLTAARARGKKVLVTVHNAEPHEDRAMLDRLHRSIFRLGDAFIVHSDANAETLRTRLRRGSPRIHVVPHIPFASVADGEGDMDGGIARGELGLDREGPLLLFFGNIREYKGLDVLLRAMREAIRAHPDLTLMVTGQPWVSWERYQDIVREEGIAKHLVTELCFLPYEELRKRIIASDLVVFPFKSLDSASGSVLLARAMGKPVVMSALPSLADIAGEGVFKAEPGCHRSLAAAIGAALRRLKESPPGAPGRRGDRPGDGAEEVVAGHLEAYAALR